MKTTTKLTKLFYVLLLSAICSCNCSNTPPALTNGNGKGFHEFIDLKKIREEQQTAPSVVGILRQAACWMVDTFITADNSHKKYSIPVSWLFPVNDIKVVSGASDFQGIHLYPALNFKNGKPYLAIVGSPVVSSNTGLIDDPEYDRICEFAQLCPDFCKSGQNATFILRENNLHIKIPSSWFVTKDDANTIINQSGVNYVKLTWALDQNNNMLLSIVGTDKDRDHQEIDSPRLIKRCPEECIASETLCD